MIYVFLFFRIMLVTRDNLRVGEGGGEEEEEEDAIFVPPINIACVVG